MNLRTLQYLVALVDHEHFGRAASACYVSQPTLSMQIKKLESWLGLQLLERTNKSVHLTQIGSHIAERARVILQDVDALKQYAQHAKNPFQGDLHIGMIHTVAPYLLPHVMPALSKGYPKISYYLTENQTDPLTDLLLQGECDLIVAALPIIHPGITVHPLYRETFYLAAPKNHALAKKKKVSVNDLQGETMLLLKEGHCLREQALAICHQSNIEIHKHFKATSLETLRHMVASGLGMTLLPALAKQYDTSKQIVYIPFTSPYPTRSIGLCWRKTNARTELFYGVAKIMQKSLHAQEDIDIEIDVGIHAGADIDTDIDIKK